MCVRWDGSFSDRFRDSNGVQQGGVLSPNLFTIYVDDLLEEFSRRVRYHFLYTLPTVAVYVTSANVVIAIAKRFSLGAVLFWWRYSKKDKPAW